MGKFSDDLKIYDLPNSGGQLHLHRDASYGRIYDYSRRHYKVLNAYESAMADCRAGQINLPKVYDSTR